MPLCLYIFIFFLSRSWAHALIALTSLRGIGYNEAPKSSRRRRRWPSPLAITCFLHSCLSQDKRFIRIRPLNVREHCVNPLRQFCASWTCQPVKSVLLERGVALP